MLKRSFPFLLSPKLLAVKSQLQEVFIPALLLVSIGILSRLLPHPPNATAISALSVFAPLFLKRIWLSPWLALIAMLGADLILGFHNLMLPVYFCVFVVSFSSYFWVARQDALLQKLKPGAANWALNLTRLPIGIKALGGAFLSSGFFFVVTNFFVWFDGGRFLTYGKGWVSLVACYTAALPFWLNDFVGHLVYFAVFYVVGFSFQRHLGFKRV